VQHFLYTRGAGKVGAENYKRWEWETITAACFEMTWNMGEWKIIMAACFKMILTGMQRESKIGIKISLSERKVNGWIERILVQCKRIWLKIKINPNSREHYRPCFMTAPTDKLDDNQSKTISYHFAICQFAIWPRSPYAVLPYEPVRHMRRS